MLNMGIRVEQARYQVIEILVNNHQREYRDEVMEYLSDDRLEDLLNKTVADIDLWLNARDVQIEFVVHIIDNKIYVSKYVENGVRRIGGVLV